MKKIKYIFASLLLSSFLACDTDYIIDPDNPEVAPSTHLVTSAQFDLAYELNDQWTGARGTLGFAQYWAETFYTDENRYALRTSQIDDLWEWPYRILTDLKKAIELVEDPQTSDLMATYGDNNNQVQACRIMMAFTFSKLVDTFGDAPYWSYGQRDNAAFEGLRLEEGVTSPAYTDIQTIYEDLLAELLDAANKMDDSKTVFNNGDHLYDGNPDKWISFAHSIRLRLAAHISDVNNALAVQVFNESDSKAFNSSADEANFTYGLDDITGGPWHQAFTVEARRDFGPALSFTELLYNRVGPFTSITEEDPRTTQYFDTRLGTTEVVGLPYGFGNATARAVSDEGIPSSDIIKQNYKQPILTYSEIEFIRSEFNGWNQANYENGVKASMVFWGVSNTDADSYIANLPAANQETVLTQKYIALYMDGLEAWTEYRRTGYPNTLTVPGDTYGSATFTTLVPDLNTIPNRVTYPQKEQLLNNTNWNAARQSLSDGDTMVSKLFWDVN
ncbi:SusD-like starch-binding protein associating with outer membrane [Tenacibaculum gallaicum]|uniref:SusD-like starch-binding protein associating with outer membrane n=1 Tax=Tenacibaculum gallaicum TaxID=561505 RepID=A0A3E0I7Z8_9FLAO|nr:SusD/RagB family nutrient-binding outer membrane lipoprotein [Tenacibaculum gallaicum]REH54769.1 SusD-like starch-binding protein associating with outer membrane [Tenacibaculum gallaicum]